MTARATAQVNLWYSVWALAALTAERNHVGTDADKTAENVTWNLSVRGQAEAAAAEKVAPLTAATQAQTAAERW